MIFPLGVSPSKHLQSLISQPVFCSFLAYTFIVSVPWLKVRLQHQEAEASQNFVYITLGSATYIDDIMAYSLWSNNAQRPASYLPKGMRQFI